MVELPVMRVYASQLSYLHDPPAEILSGQALKPFESPERMKAILDALIDDREECDHAEPRFELEYHEPPEDDLSFRQAIAAVHKEDYIDFLRTIYTDWCAEGGSRDAVLPETFLRGDLLLERDPGPNLKAGAIEKAGRYSFDLSAPITADTYRAALAACWLACRAASDIAIGEVSRSMEKSRKEAFALCRPPGHHAGQALCGGYCYINSVAVAARFIQSADAGVNKVAILDIDYHHGNGTSKIFYDDPSVLYVSLHGSPDYPYFTGAESERGSGRGLGYNINYPLKLGTGDDAYIETLERAMVNITDYQPDFLFVSLGVDTFKDDPITDFQLTLDVYPRIGRTISKIGPKVPVCFIMEGGYCMQMIGACVKGVLTGFQDDRYGNWTRPSSEYVPVHSLYHLTGTEYPVQS